MLEVVVRVLSFQEQKGLSVFQISIQIFSHSAARKTFIWVFSRTSGHKVRKWSSYLPHLLRCSIGRTFLWKERNFSIKEIIRQSWKKFCYFSTDAATIYFFLEDHDEYLYPLPRYQRYCLSSSLSKNAELEPQINANYSFEFLANSRT